MPRARRLDENHVEIARGLEAAGCSVLSLAPLGCGAPDLLVARNRQMWLLEVKKRGARGGLSSGAARSLVGQTAWAGGWRAPVHFVSTLQEALQVVGAVGPPAAARPAGDRSTLAKGAGSG